MPARLLPRHLPPAAGMTDAERELIEAAKAHGAARRVVDAEIRRLQDQAGVPVSNYQAPSWDDCLRAKMRLHRAIKAVEQET